MLGHAARTGIAVALVPVIWSLFELPNLSQMAISIGAVMAVPVLTGKAEEDRRAVVERSAQRLLGGLIGGGIGLLLLMTPLAASLWTWLFLLAAGAAIGMEMETGRHGVQTIGIQAEVAFILAMTQGWGPAVSLLPAIDRVAGMIGAITILLSITYFFGPAQDI